MSIRKIINQAYTVLEVKHLIRDDDNAVTVIRSNYPVYCGKDLRNHRVFAGRFRQNSEHKSQTWTD